MNTRRYAVLGAGRQGKAAAYDLAVFGNASLVTMLDKNTAAVAQAVNELQRLLLKQGHRPVVASGWHMDVNDIERVRNFLVVAGLDGFVSATHFGSNLALTKLAIEAGCHMVDLGGNTGVVLKQHEFHRQAASAGVSIIPDCGMAPGFDVNLACYALETIARPRELTIYCGGVPQKPKPPLGYHFPFALSGLVNECSGYADVIRGMEVAQISPLCAIEEVAIPEVGLLEATHTSGGLSTAPWALLEKFPTLETLEYKTLRYPGHWKVLQELARKGELESGLKEFERIERESPHDPEDLGIVSVRSGGMTQDGKPVTFIAEVIDCYDENTGFTAMQRLTGFHAAIALIAATEGRTHAGVTAIEELEHEYIIGEFAKRGVVVNETTAVQR